MSSSGDRRDATDREAGTAMWSGRGKEQQWEITLGIEEFHPAGHSATWMYPNISRNSRMEMIASRKGQAKEAGIFEAKWIRFCGLSRMKVVMVEKKVGAIQRVSPVPKKWFRSNGEPRVLNPDEDPLRIMERVLFLNNPLEISEVVDHVTFTSSGSGFQELFDESPRLSISGRRSSDLGLRIESGPWEVAEEVVTQFGRTRRLLPA
jgi:hypothetical protein